MQGLLGGAVPLADFTAIPAVCHGGIPRLALPRDGHVSAAKVTAADRQRTPVAAFDTR
jgi:hypothetical protein